MWRIKIKDVYKHRFRIRIYELKIFIISKFNF